MRFGGFDWDDVSAFEAEAVRWMERADVHIAESRTLSERIDHLYDYPREVALRMLSDESPETRCRGIICLCRKRRLSVSNVSVSKSQMFRKMTALVETDLDASVRQTALMAIAKLFMGEANIASSHYLASYLANKRYSLSDRICAYRALLCVVKRRPPQGSYHSPQDAFEALDCSLNWAKNMKHVFSSEFNLERDVNWDWVNSILSNDRNSLDRG